MAAQRSAFAEITERELVITRILDAPRPLVFKAWTDPQHLVHWLGPQGFTGTILQMDVRPGSTYRFHMRGPQGTDHWRQGVYREVVEPERLVFTYAWENPEGTPGPETLVTVTFEEHQGKTRLTLHQALFESIADRDSHRGGWSTSLDRLGQYVMTV